MPIIQTGGGGGGGGTPARDTSVITTASLAQDANELDLWDGGPGVRVISVETDIPARVRFYASEAHRDADESRAVGADPSGDHGCFLDVVTTAELLTVTLSPTVDVHTADGTDDIYYTIQNRSTSTDTVSVTVTFVPTEA